MKRLILMRHAKSDWSGGASNDHDRPLNPRGRAAATALGDWLRTKDLIPDQVLSSSSMRTRETYVRLDLSPEIEVTYTRDLYLASHTDILNAMHQATGDVLMMVGHNPGSGVCASMILDQLPAHPKFDQYPSGATLVADFDIATWSQADWGKANARHFVVPRDL